MIANTTIANTTCLYWPGGGVTIRSVKPRLKQVLSRRQKKQIVHPTRVPSAVLVPVYRKQGQYHILFIQRTEKVKDHKGQISFPGGAYEEQERGRQGRVKVRLVGTPQNSQQVNSPPDGNGQEEGVGEGL